MQLSRVSCWRKRNKVWKIFPVSEKLRPASSLFLPCFGPFMSTKATHEMKPCFPFPDLHNWTTYIAVTIWRSSPEGSAHAHNPTTKDIRCNETVAVQNQSNYISQQITRCRWIFSNPLFSQGGSSRTKFTLPYGGMGLKNLFFSASRPFHSIFYRHVHERQKY